MIQFNYRDLNEAIRKVVPDFSGFIPNREAMRIEALEYGPHCYIDFLDFMAADHFPDSDRVLLNLALRKISYANERDAGGWRFGHLQ